MRPDQLEAQTIWSLSGSGPLLRPTLERQENKYKTPQHLKSEY